MILNKLEIQTLEVHNNSVLLASGILTGKEFRNLKRKRNRQKKA